MKTKLIIILTTLIFACNQTGGQKTISIIDKRDSKTPMGNVDSQKDKDVEIFRIQIPNQEGKSYLIKMYRIDNGKLKSYPFGTSANDDYDKATYTWINDTTMTFKLINSSKNTSENFKMTGNGGRSQLVRDK